MTSFQCILGGGYSSETISEPFDECDHYKICYRLLANMLSGWEEIGLARFPTIEDAIAIATKAHEYFGLAFQDHDKLDEFRRLYDFHKDIWEKQK